MTTITYSAGSISPTIVDGYEATRRSATVVHDVLGYAFPDVTFRPAQSRSGSLRLVFGDEEPAHAALVAFSTHLGRFVLATDERDYLDMAFVVQSDADVQLTLDDVTRDAWIVTVPFREVSP